MDGVVGDFQSCTSFNRKATSDDVSVQGTNIFNGLEFVCVCHPLCLFDCSVGLCVVVVRLVMVVVVVVMVVGFVVVVVGFCFFFP